MLALIILAAGESSRMRFPKALLVINEETFAECIVRKANLAGVTSITVITGSDHEAIVQKLPRQIRCIKNENYMHGQISSLQKGIGAIADTETEVMVWPVDQPMVQSETVSKIVAAYKREKKGLTIPVYKQRKGHPVIYNKEVIQSALHLQPHQTAKDLQSLFGNDVTFVEVDDPAVVTDIDTPEDYEKYVSRL